MNTHAFIEYLKYKWRAKKLHGVHSPFAYSFSENVLYPQQNNTALPVAHTTLPEKYLRLLTTLKNTYNYDDPCYIDAQTSIQSLSNMIILSEKNPGNWLQLFNKYQSSIPQDCVIVVPDIHISARHTKKWHRLYTHPKILMSIDLYGLGLIFFKKEFKEKQHFILKY